MRPTQFRYTKGYPKKKTYTDKETDRFKAINKVRTKHDDARFPQLGRDRKAKW